jgi:hypothetical protein
VPEQLVQAFIEHGPIGILALVMTYWAWKLAVKLDSVQEKRVTDIEKVVTHVAAITTAVERNTEAIEALATRLGR